MGHFNIAQHNAKACKRKYEDLTEMRTKDEQRQSILNISRVKLQNAEQVTQSRRKDTSLRRSLLIYNTLKTLESDVSPVDNLAPSSTSNVTQTGCVSSSETQRTSCQNKDSSLSVQYRRKESTKCSAEETQDVEMNSEPEVKPVKRGNDIWSRAVKAAAYISRRTNYRNVEPSPDTATDNRSSPEPAHTTGASTPKIDNCQQDHKGDRSLPQTTPSRSNGKLSMLDNAVQKSRTDQPQANDNETGFFGQLSRSASDSDLLGLFTRKRSSRLPVFSKLTSAKKEASTLDLNSSFSGFRTKQQRQQLQQNIYSLNTQTPDENQSVNSLCFAACSMQLSDENSLNSTSNYWSCKPAVWGSQSSGFDRPLAVQG